MKVKTVDKWAQDSDKHYQLVWDKNSCTMSSAFWQIYLVGNAYRKQNKRREKPERRRYANKQVLK